MRKATIWKPKKTATKPRKKRYFETGFRLRKEDKENLRKRGFHVYDRRDNGREYTIEPSVGVDFMGTLITNFPIKLPKKGPSANTIYQGDTYLRKAGAERVYRVDDLKGKRGRPKKTK